MKPGAISPQEAAARQPGLRWPATRYFVSPRHRLLYCPIPKVACSSLKVWWAEYELGPAYFQEIPIGEVHRQLGARFEYQHQAEVLGEAPLVDPRWFRFVFVRNPWARLVSAFVNKFVNYTHNAATLVDEFRSRLPRRMVRQMVRPAAADDILPPWWLLRGAAAWREQFTFRQFVNHLATCNLNRADGHWRPQSRLLGKTEFHFIGRFEHLDRDFAELNRLLGRQPALRRVNATQYTAEAVMHACVSDWPLARLRELPAAPPYRSFYTPSLAETVARLYADDVQRLGYEFDDSSRWETAVSARQAA